jgi:hypothetical protein
VAKSKNRDPKPKKTDARPPVASSLVRLRLRLEIVASYMKKLAVTTRPMSRSRRAKGGYHPSGIGVLKGFDAIVIESDWRSPASSSC